MIRAKSFCSVGLSRGPVCGALALVPKALVAALMLVGMVLPVMMGTTSTIYAQDEAKPSEEQAEALAKVRKALAGRDLPGALAALKDAKQLSGDKVAGAQSYSSQLERLDELANYYGQFWNAVNGSLKGLENEAELELKGGDLAAVVEVTGETLVLRVAGKNRTYTRSNMPAGLAMLLAERVLPKDIAANLVVLGTFLALDAEGDQELARSHWEEAMKAKADIAHLMPELDIAPELPPVELPDVTPMMKNLLSNKNWLLRYAKAKEDKPAKGAGAFTKGAIEKVAKVTEEGRLVITLPEDAPNDGQVYFKKPLSGNFLCRVVLAEVGPNQTIGLLATDRDGEGWRQKLPAGTLQIEIARTNGKVSMKVAGKTYKPSPLGNAGFTGPVFLTVGVPPGGSCTVAGLEFSAR